MKKFKLIKILLIVLPLLFFVNVVKASEINCQTMLSSMELSDKNKSVKQVVESFCQKSSNKRCVDRSLGGEIDPDYFDANQSVFLSLLCDYISPDVKYNFLTTTGEDSFLKKNLLKFSGFSKLSSTKNCSIKNNDLNGCDFFDYLPKVFNEIVNDYFNIGQSRLYGIKDVNTSKFVDMANDFSTYNFVGLKICDSGSKYYTESCKHLVNYIKSAKSLLNQTKVINVKNLTINKVDCENSFKKNIVYCGLLGSDSNYENYLVNLVYNEYMRYSLFMYYYSNNLEENASLSDLRSASDQSNLADNMEKSYIITKQLYNIKEGLALSFRTLSEISATFPIHIGMVIYQENANIFMQELSKIYTPIRTLFDKLRNVQQAE